MPDFGPDLAEVFGPSHADGGPDLVQLLTPEGERVHHSKGRFINVSTVLVPDVRASATGPNAWM